ncbi:hypothetical protein CKK34_2398 [Yarrowia sp. E02]|nr:hypothetical protein CKK34_2398 [Yarrowia sp. E02]
MSSANLQLLKKQLFERQNKFAHLRREYDLLLEQFDKEQKKIDAAIASFTTSLQALDTVRDNLKLQLEHVQEQQKELSEMRDMETSSFYANHSLPTNFFSSNDKSGVLRDARGLVRHPGDVIRDTKHARDVLNGKQVPKSGLYRKDRRIPSLLG